MFPTAGRSARPSSSRSRKTYEAPISDSRTSGAGRGMAGSVRTSSAESMNDTGRSPWPWRASPPLT
ncbi:hypothetical protein SMCF_8855, partial [Streptomyces coelicoflavus ZG0656]